MRLGICVIDWSLISGLDLIIIFVGFFACLVSFPSSLKDDNEEVGDVYQDDNSEAAILVNHDVNDDAIILVSSFHTHTHTHTHTQQTMKR